MDPIRILLVAGSSIFRRGLYEMLVSRARFDVAEPVNPSLLSVQLAQHNPAVVLIYEDRTLSTDIPELIQRIKTQQPNARVLVVADEIEPAGMSASVAAGAHGYLHGDLTLPDLEKAIQDMMCYGLILGNGVAPIVRERLLSEAEQSYPERLTAQERVIAELVVRGLSNREVAARLHLSVNTVKSHLRNIYEELGIHSRMELIRLARQ